MTAGAAPSFAALRHRGFQAYFATCVLAMMADNIEHVISYWLMFQRFHSPALAGFAVISHWLPFLLLSLPVGALAERVDPRRIIQAGMLLFIGVSLAWGWFFVSGTLQVGHAMLLLVLHGVAGVLWQTSGQLLLHDIVEPAVLPSAVRLAATARYLGVLVGPAVGGLIMLTLGPAHGIFLNAVFYLPLLLWLWKAPYGPRFRAAAQQQAVRAVHGLGDLLQAAREVAQQRLVLSMIVLAGAASFFVGNSYQAQMPGLADDLGHGDPGTAYSALLAADAAGALLAGFLLESWGALRSSPRTAALLAMAWCVALGGFALVRSYPLALAFLFTAGFFELAFSSMAQALVQVNAPAAMRGRVIGLFNMAAMGLRTFAGVTVGLVGSLAGVHASLAAAAGCMLALTLWLRWRWLPKAA
jgi:MFS family permease